MDVIAEFRKLLDDKGYTPRGLIVPHPKGISIGPDGFIECTLRDYPKHKHTVHLP